MDMEDIQKRLMQHALDKMEQANESEVDNVQNHRTKHLQDLRDSRLQFLSKAILSFAESGLSAENSLFQAKQVIKMMDEVDSTFPGVVDKCSQITITSNENNGGREWALLAVVIERSPSDPTHYLVETEDREICLVERGKDYRFRIVQKGVSSFNDL